MEQYKDNLKERYGLKINNDVFASVQAQFDSTKLDDDYSNSTFKDKMKNLTAFQLNGKDYSVDYILNYYLKEKSYPEALIDSSLVKNLVNKRTSDLLFETKSDEMEKTDPEFADVIEEYKNGILIFKLQEIEVWSKINVDSAGMYNYYQEHKSDFQWGQRVSYKAVICDSDSLIKNLHASVLKNKNFDEMFDNLYNRKSSVFKTTIVNLVDADKDNFSKEANKLNERGDISNVFRSGDRTWTFVELVEKQGPRTKTFEEAQNEVAGPYQEILTKEAEENYVKRLDEIYKPVKYYDALKDIFK